MCKYFGNQILSKPGGQELHNFCKVVSYNLTRSTQLPQFVFLFSQFFTTLRIIQTSV